MFGYGKTVTLRTKEGHMAIGSDQAERIEFQLHVGNTEKDAGGMIIIACNARNTAKGNYIILIQATKK